ncbi:AGE family epimerase/isomerase [Rapidithrix thailandica]|uniref:AGE family epimerase/isomerase n=1 Tax=Rapidithrix thailandica TaxID=413964 RepID=A0AAW9S3J3_9BACT
MKNFKNYPLQYKNALLQNVIPFWENHSIDRKYGGYFTCLDQRGKVFDTDKFVWLQGRQVWTFSMLYNKVEKREEWLETATFGAEFLKKYGRDRDRNFYFSLDRKGTPLIQAYNIFSDCFAAMAFNQYALATGKSEYLDLGVTIFNTILKRKNNPKGKYEKSTGNRPLQNFALPMILSNLVLELESALKPELVEETLSECVHLVMNEFLDPNDGLVYENIAADGSHPDTFEGRLINPGHGIEAMWFIMDIAKRQGNQTLIEQAVATTLQLIEYGWDQEFGGIFYFLDAQGKPPLQLEWDQKLWWVHLEALVALSKAYQLTQNPEVVYWLEKIHQYSWTHFADPQYGEWFGYLNRQGKPLLSLKGGKWKGCFHVPRAMYQCWKTLENV